MPKFLEKKLSKEYHGDKHAIYGTLNKLGYMKGSKETKKGELAEAEHEIKEAGCKHCGSKHHKSSEHKHKSMKHKALEHMKK